MEIRGGACDDEFSVPLVGQPDQDPGLAGWIVGNARIELNARYWLGDCRAVRRDWARSRSGWSAA